jgi:H+/Cl- antiporter ClcA
MKVKSRASLFLWVFICIFLIFWLGIDLWSGVYLKEIQDLRTGNKLLLDERPIWFWIVFTLKFLAMMACLYFLYAVGQMISFILKSNDKEKAKIK